MNHAVVNEISQVGTENGGGERGFKKMEKS